MKTQTITTYEYDELSEEGKENAREWWLKGGLDYDWWYFVYEDVKEIGQLLGIEIDNIYFSGFWSDGDGACFEGSYSYAKGSVKRVKAHAPQDKVLHEIALDLSRLQRKHFYGMQATVRHSGHYYHELYTSINVYDRDGDFASVDADDCLSSLLRDYMRWIYRRLEVEYEWLMSEEHIVEDIRANGLEFTEDGEIV